MEKLIEEMKLRGFSPRTIKTYSYYINDFIAYCEIPSAGKKREYVLYQINKGREPDTVRLASAAVDFYLRSILKQNPPKTELPKRRKKLPNVLTKEQIKEMINSTTNIKHQIVIELLYSSGLRLSELINLRHEDINFEKSTVRINQGKGNKDRLSIISRTTADKIKTYCNQGFILNGRKGKYSKKSVHLVLQKAAKKAKINQHVTPHMMRHSFATHLLESGVDIRYIQALLGHESLRTTQIYTKVAVNKIEQIKSPLDT